MTSKDLVLTDEQVGKVWAFHQRKRKPAEVCLHNGNWIGTGPRAFHEHKTTHWFWGEDHLWEFCMEGHYLLPIKIVRLMVGYSPPSREFGTSKRGCAVFSSEGAAWAELGRVVRGLIAICALEDISYEQVREALPALWPEPKPVERAAVAQQEVHEKLEEVHPPYQEPPKQEAEEEGVNPGSEGPGGPRDSEDLPPLANS